ncbi:MAG: hypothetical protein PF570_02435 [Candidatus Cloacimonetes bacterium]|jgi:hypothetical protein|nr:hypothetical protein [Candidatus Cloacimonadota bacterium]
MKKTILIIAIMALAATAIMAAGTPQVTSETKVTITNDTPSVCDGTGIKAKLQDGSKEVSEYKYNYRRNYSYSYRHNNSNENSNCQYGKSNRSNRKK